MSASNQSRIDIPVSVPDKCSLQCMFWYDFKTAVSTTISDDTKSLQLTYDAPGSNILYNSTVYTLDTIPIQIYAGGIHTFNTTDISLEIVINLISEDRGTHLYVCIPVSSNGPASSTNAIQEIIDAYFPSHLNNSLSVNQFNLNYIIPKTSFIVHTGVYHNTSDSNSIYLVFPYPSFNLSLDIINKAITGTGRLSTYTLPSSNLNLHPPMFQSEQGTSVNGFSETGQIYIDCQPTDQEGEIVVKEQIVPSSFYKFNMSGLIYFIVVVVSCIVLITLYQKMKDFFTLNSPNKI